MKVYKELETNDSLYAKKKALEQLIVWEIDKKLDDIHNILLGFDQGFNQIFTSWNEMITSFTEIQKALIQNIQEHIQLVSSVTGIAKDISTTAMEHGQIISLLKQT